MAFAADGIALAVAGAVNASTKLVSMNDEMMISATEIRHCFDKRGDAMIIIIISRAFDLHLTKTKAES